MTSRTVRSLIGLAAATLLLGACSGSEPAVGGRAPRVDPDHVTTYAALGDSYSSGPGIDPQRADGRVCLRSAANYPTLVAKELGIRTVADVTCAGATTDHVLGDVPIQAGQTVQAQLDAVTAATDLVTITIGYNNDGIFGQLYGTCLTSRTATARTCQTYVKEAEPKILTGIRKDVAEVLGSIRRKAPDAEVVLIGYLPLLPALDPCPASLITGGNERLARGGEQAADDALRSVAAQAGVEFLSMRMLARGHGVCAGADAWVNGATPAAGDGAIFHPRKIGMEAVAGALVDRLRAGR